jgi:hypothetical protein
VRFEDLGPEQLQAWRDKRDYLIFMLGEGLESAKAVKPTEVLQAYSSTLLSRSSTMSRDTSSADLWIARNGDPLSSIDSALRAVELAGVPSHVKIEYDITQGAQVTFDFLGKAVETRGDTVPIAIALAGLELLNRKEKRK